MVRHSYPSDVIRRFLRSGSCDRAEKLIDKLPLSNLSSFLEELTPLEARALFDIVFSPERVERTLQELPRRDLGSILEQADDDRLVRLLCRLTGPRSARLVAVLPPERRKAIKRQIDGQARSFTQAVRPVSSLMRVVKQPLSPEMTVAEALELMPQEGAAPRYVVDGDRRLLGRVSRTSLCSIALDRRLGEVMEPVTGAVRSSMPVCEVVPMLQRAGSLPVADGEGRVVGELLMDSVLPLVNTCTHPAHTGPSISRGWRRLLPWFTGSLVLAASAAGWATGLLHF